MSQRYILYTSVCAPGLACQQALLMATAVALSLCAVPFVMRELVLGPEAKLEIEIICPLHFPLTDTNWNQIISECCPLRLSQSNKPCALFWGGGVGGGKAGLGSLKREEGAVEREGGTFQLA